MLWHRVFAIITLSGFKMAKHLRELCIWLIMFLLYLVLFGLKLSYLINSEEIISSMKIYNIKSPGVIIFQCLLTVHLLLMDI